MPTLEHTFDSEVQLSNIQTDITGAETATLTEADYTESGTGPYTYTATYNATADGDYTFTISTAETSAAESATWGGQSTTFTLAGVPSSALLHFPFKERSNTTLVEELQGADGTANGLTNISGTYRYGYAEDGDATDDFGDLGNWNEVNFGSGMGSGGFGVLLTVETTESTEAALIGNIDNVDATETSFYCRINRAGNDGYVQFRVDDENGNSEAVEAQSNTAINDGSKHRLAIDAATDVASGSAPSASEMNIWLDGSKLSVTTNFSQGASTFNDFTYAVFSHANNSQGSSEIYNDAIIDNVIPTDGTLTDQQIQDDYSNQPWS